MLLLLSVIVFLPAEFLSFVYGCVSTVWMCEAYVKMWVGIWWILLWCVCIVMCGGVYVWVLYFMDV